MRENDKYFVCFDMFIDGGTPISLVTSHVIPADLWKPYVSENEFCGVNSSKLEICGRFERIFTMQGIKIPIKFYVVP